MRSVGHPVSRCAVSSRGNVLREAFASWIGEKRHGGIIALLPATGKRKCSREHSAGFRLPSRGVAGTVLARAARENWTRQIATAKLVERPELARELARPDAISATTPMQSAALSMQARGERHIGRMAGVTEKVLPHLEGMEPDEILSRVDQVEKLDRIARRNFGLNDGPAVGLHLHLHRLDGSQE